MENNERKDLTFKQLNDAIEFHYKEMLYYSELKGEKLAAKILELTNKLHGLEKGFEKHEESCIKSWLENGLTDNEIIEGIYQERYARHSHVEEANTEVNFERKKVIN